jgi:3-hydroxyisobutyrate dehydrogenase-like beta-hydroxyacid dehydrogenase
MRIGFIGLGNIGGAIAANLASDGFEVLVRDPDERRAAAAAAAGAQICGDVAAVACRAEVTFLSLPTPDDVDAVAAQWLAAAPADAVLVDLSTNSPDRVRSLGSRITAAGRHLVDAPLSGGAPGAQARMLMFMVGGSDAAVARVRPILDKVGRATFHLGPLGSGSVAKLVNSMVAFSTTMATLEALALASKAGLDLRAMVTVLRTGGAGNFYTNMAVEGIERRGDAPQFALGLAAKDAELIRALEAECGVPARFSTAIADLLRDACSRGMAQRDWTHLPGFFEQDGGLRFSLAPEPVDAAAKSGST